MVDLGSNNFCRWVNGSLAVQPEDRWRLLLLKWHTRRWFLRLFISLSLPLSLWVSLPLCISLHLSIYPNIPLSLSLLFSNISVTPSLSISRYKIKTKTLKRHSTWRITKRRFSNLPLYQKSSFLHPLNFKSVVFILNIHASMSQQWTLKTRLVKLKTF